MAATVPLLIVFFVWVASPAPLLAQARAFGPSIHDRNSYYLMRAYGIEERDRSETSFYDSPTGAGVIAMPSWPPSTPTPPPSSMWTLRY